MDAGAVAALSSGAVALATIGAGVVTHRGTLRHARTITDLESARGVLDDAAVALHELDYALENIDNGLTTLGVTFFEDELAVGVYDDLGLKGKEVDRHKERLGIRLGRGHEAVAAFGAAAGAALETYQTLWRLRREGDPGVDERAQLRRDGVFADACGRIEAQREVFDAKREQFVDAAQKVAGTKLPPQN